MAMQPCQQCVLGAVPPERIFCGAAAEARAVGGIGGAEPVLDPLGRLVRLDSGDVLPPLDCLAVVTIDGAALGALDQKREVGLDAAREVMIESGVDVIQGRIRVACQQEGTAEMYGSLRVSGLTFNCVDSRDHDSSGIRSMHSLGSTSFAGAGFGGAHTV